MRFMKATRRANERYLTNLLIKALKNKLKVLHMRKKVILSLEVQVLAGISISDTEYEITNTERLLAEEALVSAVQESNV